MISQHEGLPERLLAAYDAGTRLPLPTSQHESFTVADAYGVASRTRELRIARGERAMGYKIGFTNRSIWARYGVHAPIWGPVWDSTLSLFEDTTHTISLAGLVQPRLEPEIVFGFAAAPAAGMSLAELAGCIAWVAHGFEIVQTHFDDWRFEAADTVADFALHGRLMVGPRVPVQAFGDLARELAGLKVELQKGASTIDRGEGHIVLDGPLNALRLWVDAMHDQVPQWPIQAGDIVTTGTITDAWPLAPGEVWTSRLDDPKLPGLTLHLEA